MLLHPNIKKKWIKTDINKMGEKDTEEYNLLAD